MIPCPLVKDSPLWLSYTFSLNRRLIIYPMVGLSWPIRGQDNHDIQWNPALWTPHYCGHPTAVDTFCPARLVFPIKVAAT